MTFRKKWFSSKVESSDGYSVEFFVDVAAIVYRDAQGVVFVSSERLAATHTWAIFPADMRVDSAHGEQLANEELRTLIVNRIQAVCDFYKWRLEIA